MNCQTCRIEIEELELGCRLSEQAAGHIASCPPCRAFHDERQTLRRLVGSLDAVSAPPDFEFRLRARLAATGNGGDPRPSWRTFISSVPAVGLAATIALLVAGVVLYNQIKSGTTKVIRSGEIARQEPSPQAETQSTGSAMSPEATPEVRRDENQKQETLTAGVKNQPAPLKARGKNIRRQLRRFEAGTSQDIASKSAPQIRPAGDLQLAENAGQLRLPVRSSSQPVRVLVNDRNGGRRTVSLQPVIFGSQDLTGRTDARLPLSQGIW